MTQQIPLEMRIRIEEARWRVEISELLRDLTAETRELSEIVHEMAVRLADAERALDEKNGGEQP